MSYVLIVEDDTSISYLLQFYISLKGIPAMVCPSVKSVEECLQDNGEPSIVLLDYILRNDKASDIVSTIRSYYSKVDICLMTAITNPNRAMEELKINKLLTKPFTLEQLDEVLGVNRSQGFVVT